MWNVHDNARVVTRREMMIRSKIWFRCAVVHDPVTPKIVQPAVIGWDAKQRRIDLTIERPFKGDELLRRMKGWITVRTRDVIETVNRHGRLNILDERDLVVEYDTIEQFRELREELKVKFGTEVEVELIEEKKVW